MIRKTTKGYYLVTLPLSAEFMRVAMEHWERLGFKDPEDYLSGVLNMGMLREDESAFKYQQAVDKANGIEPPKFDPATPMPPGMDDGLPF